MAVRCWGGADGGLCQSDARSGVLGKQDEVGKRLAVGRAFRLNYVLLVAGAIVLIAPTALFSCRLALIFADLAYLESEHAPLTSNTACRC